MDFHQGIQKLSLEFSHELSKVKSLQDIENLKIKYLGKKGYLAELMTSLKNALPEERPLIGKEINDLKVLITSEIEKQTQHFETLEIEKQLLEEKIDISLPGREKFHGKLHPLTSTIRRMVTILGQMGFTVEVGPNLESDFYNFEGLNFKKDHPARDMQDTFYVSENLLLRTHTSNVQVRTMEKNTLPIRVCAPGRCFRNEDISTRSHVFFHQVEGFYIDEKVSFADLFATLDDFWQKLFGKKVKTRYRPSYFPFVEPGVEMDIECSICSGKGCRICKHSGWLEVVGAGMIHPEVLKSGGIDPEKYSGYAFGLGPGRLTMLLNDIKDIRLFTENDIRFLDQF
jgi:phenylalanyl-tRNA synthetase alpha chain